MKDFWKWLLLFLFICGISEARYTYNPYTAKLDKTGVEVSADVSVVCDSGQVMTSSGAGVWACAASSGGITTASADLTYVPYAGAISNVVLGTKSITASNLSGTNTGDNTVATALTGTPSITVATVTTTGNIELGHASDTTIARSGAGAITVESVAVPTISSTNTLTNKRITSRVLSAASYTTDTGTSLNIDNYDAFFVTAQAGALKFNNPSGTPTENQKLIIRIKDNATARALTYDTQYRAMGTALPSTTVLSKTLYMGFIFNITDTKWDLVAAAQEA